MTPVPNLPYTSFDGVRRITSGTLKDVALSVKLALDGGAHGPVLLIDNYTGRSIDVDLRGTTQVVAQRLDEADTMPAPRGPGRPKLGVVSREVTLLPRHWQWLASQRGGASATLRRLVDEARKANADKDERDRSRDGTYQFMAALAGDLPGFEEATRALFAADSQAFDILIAQWPPDIRDHARLLAASAFTAA